MAVMRIGTQCWPTMKIPPVSDSAAEAMTGLMVLHITWNGALAKGVVTVSGSWLKMYQAAAQIRYFFSTRYAESDSRLRTISLA